MADRAESARGHEIGPPDRPRDVARKNDCIDDFLPDRERVVIERCVGLDGGGG
jgi:hypothetical protein